jgi:hypothetical protein
MDRRKELKEQYKQLKPDMGVFAVCSGCSNKCYIESTKDLKSRINSTRFKLDAGNYPIRELQKEWKEHGADCFTIKILEKLEYDKDGSKTDYADDLDLLKMIWEEKLLKKGYRFYEA